eukprot:CAMPEP_0114250656 /NCGR_PEP_ID=MMETSP0058-20121206/14823_1 /TAXON_ID=36894 /ORGANISM="Pyramimonas parkeae, CCMP726" /LENGTH=106 /DNA_ID=CAMNT_0001364345 /DNA_START=30 /DNA_END=350 /DNA_ORIENTATION=+
MAGILRALRSPSLEYGASFFLRHASAAATATELEVQAKLEAALQPTHIVVQDTSGGCGSMYSIEVESEKFVGLRIPKQHQLVTAVIEDEIKQWHGFTLKTSIPEKK